MVGYIKCAASRWYVVAIVALWFALAAFRLADSAPSSIKKTT
jgi:hypothetical protein